MTVSEAILHHRLMAWLNFNAHAYDLESAVGIIRRGLDAALRALQEDEDRVKTEMADNDRRIAAGEAPGAELDEDGDLIFDPNECFHYDFMTIDDTVMEVKKSMMIALYHAWERVVRKMTGKTGPKDNHTVLQAALEGEGVKLTPELDHLRRLINLVKHNSKEKAVQLWSVRPDLFYRGFDPDQHFPDDWSESVRLSPDQIESFFAAVLASGPKQPRAAQRE